MSDPGGEFERHIKEAGVSAQVAKKKLGWKMIQDASKIDPSFLKLPAFTIPYFKPDGKRLPNFLRVRYLEELPPSFAKKKKAPPRYAQKKGSGMEVYLPPLGGRSWKEISKDSNFPLFITEGEKKAVAATARGFHCIGLGGVWSFRDSLTKEFLPALKEMEWAGRNVFVVFDSDLIEKKEVRQALVELSKMLRDQGAHPRVVRLPHDGGSKNGLDDFLLEFGAKAFEKLVQTADDIVQNAKLAAYNDRFCVIQFPPEIRALDDGEKTWSLANSAFVTAFNGDTMPVIDSKGNASTVPVASEWLDWPQRNTAGRTIFSPDLSFPMCWSDGEQRYNLWRGWGVEAKRGPTEVWSKLLRGVFSGRKDLIQWFEQWLAYPIQNPGSKCYQAVLIWGVGQATGKSSIGKFMLEIYGPHGRELSDDSFVNGFNGWIEGTSFVMADDLSNENPKMMKSTLKRLVASEHIEVHRKYRDSYGAKNHVQFLFTAQSPTAIPMDANQNRRYFIVRAPDVQPYPEAWYTETMDNYLHGDGPAFVRYRLERLKLNGYSPHGDAPDTPDGEETVAASAPEVSLWLTGIKSDPSGWLKERKLPEDLDVMTADQIVTWARQDLENPKAKLVLRDAANIFLRVGQSAPFPDGSRPVLYAFRNASRYKGNTKRAKSHFQEKLP